MPMPGSCGVGVAAGTGCAAAGILGIAAVVRS